MATKWQDPEDIYESDRQHNEQVKRDRFDKANPPGSDDNMHDKDRRHNEQVRRDKFDRGHQ